MSERAECDWCKALGGIQYGWRYKLTTNWAFVTLGEDPDPYHFCSTFCLAEWAVNKVKSEKRRTP